MDTYSILLVVEAVVIAGLSLYIWIDTRDGQHVTTLHWIALFLLVLVLIGFGTTIAMDPIAM